MTNSPYMHTAVIVIIQRKQIHKLEKRKSLDMEKACEKNKIYFTNVSSIVVTLYRSDV